MKSLLNPVGVLNIYKEKGYTSQDVAAITRKALGYVKAGHTGTLDPQAVGVLPVCVGAATKIADYIGDVKTYKAEICLGIETDTQDMTGRVLKRQAALCGEAEIRRVIGSFVGNGWQTPPMYSAVKIKGRKLYELARAGQVVERRPRPVCFYEIKILESSPKENRVVIETVCSKGAYIRTLASDIGRSLGCGACMGELTRLRVGPFDLEDSITPAQLAQLVADNRLTEKLHKIEDVLPYPRIEVPEALEKPLRNGHAVELSSEGTLPGDKVFLTLRGETAGIYIVRRQDSRMWYKPAVMLITR